MNLGTEGRDLPLDRGQSISIASRVRWRSASRAIGCLAFLVLTAVRAQEGHEHHHSMESMSMTASTTPLGLDMSRIGSGTAWQPDDTPMAGVHFQPGAGWDLMLHWNLVAGFDAQTTPRGGHQWTSMNWVMFMAQHDLLGGQVTGRVMLSAEPFTTGGKRGYPLLLQTGEEVGGEQLHDRQHPHDFFMEVAAIYQHELTRWLAMEVYAAASGEPALGPVAFPHRASAMPNPFAALGHHWQDSTHIAFGVLTAGLYTEWLKLEGSGFNGREPDENRYGFDFGSLDSWSLRLSWNPARQWSAQVSYGHLAEPEAHAPGVSVDRFTASVLHSWRPGPEASWNTSLVYGQNWYSGPVPTTRAVLLESALEWKADTVFGRLEYVQRSGDDLALEHEATAPPGIATEVFDSCVLELGYVRRLATFGPLNVGLGVVGSLYVLDGGLRGFYGGQQFPVAGMVFLRLWPVEMRHSMPGMNHASMEHGG
jgi:hypothetical protein